MEQMLSSSESFKLHDAAAARLAGKRLGVYDNIVLTILKMGWKKTRIDYAKSPVTGRSSTLEPNHGADRIATGVNAAIKRAGVSDNYSAVSRRGYCYIIYND